MERELKDSEQWLTATLKSLGEAVITTDINGKIKTINPFAEVLTGWKREDALGKPLATVFNVISEGTDKHVKDPIKKAIQEGSYYGLADRTLLIAKEGAKMPVDIIGSAIKDDRDNIIGIALIFYDIIERGPAGPPRQSLSRVTSGRRERGSHPADRCASSTPGPGRDGPWPPSSPAGTSAAGCR